MRRGPVLVAVLALALAGCGDDGTSITEQMRQGDQKGYVAGSGLVEQLAPPLDEALADDTELTAEERSSRSGLANRQVTIR